ncbi:MAG: hypothetical protein ABIL02_06950, partial [candidate division WOR-3 bacterium]
MLIHCAFEFAGSDTAAIYSRDWGEVIIKSCEISKSGSFGYYESFIRAGRQLPISAISNCAFRDNDNVPLRVSFSSVGEIDNNVFENNGLQVIEVIASARRISGIIVNPNIPYWFIAKRYSSPDFRFCVQSGSNDSCVTLSIAPGTKFFFEDSTVLIVGGYYNRGKIVAQGNETDSIIFTALDTTTGWQGIHIEPRNIADTSVFEYCRVDYAGQRVWGWAYGEAGGLMAMMHAPLVVKNSTISHSKRMGIDLYFTSYGDLSTGAIIEGNSFVGNDSFHLKIPANDLRNLRNNIFLDNAIYVRGERINRSFSLDYQGAPFIISSNITVGQSGDTIVMVELNKDNCFKFMSNTEIMVGLNGGL